MREPRGQKCPSAFLLAMSAPEAVVGDRIRALREGRGWLQRELAAVAQLPVRTVGRIERGEVDVRLSTVAKIAAALGVPLKELMP